MREDYVSAALFEQRFWLQVLGDHARFIFSNLAPSETEEIARAESFIGSFDGLLTQARRALSAAQAATLSRQALRLASELREFKLHLLRRQLTGKIGFHLPPSFVNHMVNELEECLRVLQPLAAGQLPPVFGPLHHHLLWLSDAVGHAESLGTSVDMTEKELMARSGRFAEHFQHLYTKAVEMAGYLRANVAKFPALNRLNKDAELEIRLFQSFLVELAELNLSKEALGTLMPLIPDHMFREECYYLTKLSQVADNVTAPDCDPGKPRLE